MERGRSGLRPAASGDAGIDHLVDGYHDKDGRDADGRYSTAHVLAGIDGVVFVDDRPDDMPLGADVIAVSPYLSPNPHDRGLDRRARTNDVTDRSRVPGTDARLSGPSVRVR